MQKNILSQVKILKALLESKQIDASSVDKYLKTAIYLAIWPKPRVYPLGLDSVHETFKKMWDNIQNEEVSDYTNEE